MLNNNRLIIWLFALQFTCGIHFSSCCCWKSASDVLLSYLVMIYACSTITRLQEIRRRMFLTKTYTVHSLEIIVNNWSKKAVSQLTDLIFLIQFFDTLEINMKCLISWGYLLTCHEFLSYRVDLVDYVMVGETNPCAAYSMLSFLMPYTK